jgi:oligopeptide transport system permease protein
MAKKQEQAVNEFNQVVEGNSLGKDAWRRLKKNKMAIIGMVTVIVYALLSAFAPLLPLHPYDEIILDHQQLPPSLHATAGELMLKNKLQDMYFQAWRNGELKLTPEQDAQIKAWIKDSKTTKVWSLVYTEGEAQRQAGTFAFNASAQRTLDRLQTKIASELFVTISKAYYTDSDGKKHDISKMSYQELVPIYADLIGADQQKIIAQTEVEVKNQILNDVKAKTPDLSDEDAQLNVELELKSMGEKGFNETARQNVYGKILTQAQKTCERDLTKQAKDGTVTFPLKESYQLNDSIDLSIEASKKHSRRYLLGTDYVGRDMLSRIIYGGQVSIAIGLVGTLTSVLIGILIGALAGYVGGKTDYILMRIVDIMYGLPYMLLVIICMAIFGRNIINLFVALAMVSWLTIARMVRGQIMSLKNSEFVEAARSMGASTLRIILKHMIPNSLSVIIIYSTLRVPAFIMQESFLSFLGLGVQAPYASWGSLVGDAVDGMTLYPWRLLFPALAMTIFLFAMNFFGDGLRDAFDPQSKNQL